MRNLFGAMVIASSIISAGCGNVDGTPNAHAALTVTDVDVAPECHGVISYANSATFAELDAYLPSNAVTNLVAQRGYAPFTSLADILAVDQISDYRLGQIYQAAVAGSWVNPACVGIYDRLAVSADDQQAMVSLVNTVSSTELHDVLPNAWNGAVNLLAARPFTNVAGISNTSGIGQVSLRGIRNAATLSRPLEQLAATINSLPRDTTLLRHFDWYHTMVYSGSYRLNGMTCFGIDPNLPPNGTQIRANLADATEVYNYVQSAVSFANRYHQFDPTAGLANLQERIAGRNFFGCYISYSNDPWSGNNLGFFVDPASGFSVLAETRWSE